jgi:hypothetical protein
MLTPIEPYGDFSCPSLALATLVPSFQQNGQAGVVGRWRVQVGKHMANKKPNLDDMMGPVHTVADVRLLLTGDEVLDLAKLVRYVLEHADQFEDEESRAVGRTSDIVNAAEILQQALEAEGYSYSEDE